ncbi:MAG: hypothetical protein LBL91_05240 [Lachnospiraceae bacterium]|jgi:hypothetical protein|nr:hypothetical protein [Lachnospiraceae bacterium]
MASNPMKTRSNNSFFLGMLVMLIIAGIAIAGIIFYFNNSKTGVGTKSKDGKTTQLVYKLTRNVASGEEITLADLVPEEINTEITADKLVNSTSFQGQMELETGTMVDERFIAKIALPSGTVVTTDMLALRDNTVTTSGGAVTYKPDLRLQEYNMIQLPSNLQPGNYVDIRFRLSDGQDFIVVSKKQVMETTQNAIWIVLDESEIMLMSNAIVESYILGSSLLYATTYTEPGLQAQASHTYLPSTAVINAISKDPNITVTARNALVAEFNSDTNTDRPIRSTINGYISSANEEALSAIQEKITESQTKAAEERANFLSGM